MVRLEAPGAPRRARKVRRASDLLRLALFQRPGRLSWREATGPQARGAPGQPQRQHDTARDRDRGRYLMLLSSLPASDPQLARTWLLAQLIGAVQTGDIAAPMTAFPPCPGPLPPTPR